MEELPNSAVIRWSGDRSWFTADMPYDHAIEIDEPEPIGGSHGARPTDLLLAAVASCSGISAQAILTKMRQPVTGLVVTASGERDVEWPKAYRRILLSFQVAVEAGHKRELVEKAIDRAVKKYCPVSATIESGEGGTVVDYEVRIVEGDGKVHELPRD